MGRLKTINNNNQLKSIAMNTNFNLSSDEEKFKWMKEHLYVPIVCDVLDNLGYRNQAMHQRLRPLDPQHCTFV